MHTLLVLFIFAEMLHKLLNDPIIKSRSTLYRLLSKRKAEAQSASQHLRGSMLEARKGLSPDMKIFCDERCVVYVSVLRWFISVLYFSIRTAAAVKTTTPAGSCRICGEHRDLDTRGMCRPCHLKQNLHVSV